MLKLFSDRMDRQILSLWLTGSSHSETANIVGLTPEAVRKRWQKIKATLQESFGDQR